MMKNVMNYIKEHAKKFIVGAVLFVLTFGLSVAFKIYRKKVIHTFKEEA